MKRVLLLLAAASLLWGASIARAGLIEYEVFLDGPSESPPNASPGTGFATIVIDDTAHTLSMDLSFSDLIGTTTAAHIHCCTAVPFTGTAGVATTTPFFTGFPIGVTSGTYAMVFDLTLASSYNPAFVTASGGTVAGAEAALLGGMALGEAYLNIHTSFAPSGEIRGFLSEAAAPEPATLALLGLGLVGLGWRRHKPV